MGLPAQRIESEALELPKAERLRLALRLLESVEELEPADPAEVERFWVREADRRYQAYLRGEELAIPAEEVFREFRKQN